METSNTSLPAGLAQDVALCMAMYEGQPVEAKRDGLKAVAEQHELSVAKLKALLSLPYVLDLVRQARSELTEDSLFKHKARAFAERALVSAASISQDDRQPAAARMDANKHIVKWAGLDSPEQDGAAGPARATVEIIFAGDSKQGLVIDADGDKARARLPESIEVDTKFAQELARLEAENPK